MSNLNIFVNEKLNRVIKIQEDIIIRNVLGVDVEFKNDMFVVVDNEFWQSEKRYKTKDEAMDYVNNLMSANNINEYNFYKHCEKHSVREKSIIEFDDKKKGIVLGKEFCIGCISYAPVKKDGNISKQKRNLYSGTSFKVVKY